MIVDYENNVMEHWNDSGRQLMIKARPGNGITDMAKAIMNQMIKEDYSILLLTKESSIWRLGLDKSEKTLIGPYEALTTDPGEFVEIDFLVIDKIFINLPIENVKYKYILVLSDESNWTPPFFKGEILRIIEWNNISNMIFSEDRTLYKISSDDEGIITLFKHEAKKERNESFELPVSILEELLLHHKRVKKNDQNIRT